MCPLTKQQHSHTSYSDCDSVLYLSIQLHSKTLHQRIMDVCTNNYCCYIVDQYNNVYNNQYSYDYVQYSTSCNHRCNQWQETQLTEGSVCSQPIGIKIQHSACLPLTTQTQSWYTAADKALCGYPIRMQQWLVCCVCGITERLIMTYMWFSLVSSPYF